jgi:hypothetical protein
MNTEFEVAKGAMRGGLEEQAMKAAGMRVVATIEGYDPSFGVDAAIAGAAGFLHTGPFWREGLADLLVEVDDVVEVSWSCWDKVPARMVEDRGANGI